MIDGAESIRQQLDAYLDGRMSAVDRERFERTLARHPELRYEADLQSEIDRSLMRTMAPPSASALAQIARRVLEQRDEPGRSRPAVVARLRPLGIAASLALMVAGVWLTWRGLTQGTVGEPYVPLPRQTFVAAYHEKLETGFEPAWVCETDEIFRETFRKQYGQPLQIAELPEGTRMLGLSYANTITPWTTCILAQADDDPIVIFVDRARSASGIADPPAESGLSMYRRNLGELVICELTPRDAPSLLDAFYNPDVTDVEDPTGSGEDQP